MPTESTASQVQMKTQRVMLSVVAAIIAATSAVKPMMTVPHPDTAVNVAAASIVSRMKRRLSIARACISGGSAGRRGMTRAMGGEWQRRADLSSALRYKARTTTKGAADRRALRDRTTRSDLGSAARRALAPDCRRARWRITGREALLARHVHLGVGSRHSCTDAQHRFVELRDVSRLPARDQPLVFLHWLVHPVAARIADVGLQARPRRQGAPGHRIR